MTGRADPDGDRTDDVFAAEYVLRLLDPAQDAVAAQRMHGDPAFARRVGDWIEDLAPLTDEVAEVDPPARVKTALDAALFDAGAPAPEPVWRRLWVWQGLSLAALALAAAMAALLVLRPPEPGVAPLFAAALSGADSTLRVVAVLDPGTGRVRLARTAGRTPQGRVLELWAIAGDATLVSLGVLPDARSASAAVPLDLAAAPAGLVLAISSEPPGGSPSGAPTGPVLALGTLTGL